MSNQPPKQRIQVPDSLRDVLLEFSIAYLLEQPGDVIDYAVEFFTKLQENRRSTASHGAQDDVPPSPDESIMSLDEGKFSIIISFHHAPPRAVCGLLRSISWGRVHLVFGVQFKFIDVNERIGCMNERRGCLRTR